jgi:uncharacterized protein (TIGR03437 family)
VVTFTIRVTDSRQQIARANLSILVTGPLPEFTAGSVLNSASFAAGLAQGGFFSIFGKNLAPGADQARQLPLPSSLNGVSVRWNGITLPLLSVSSGQINFQAPFDTTGRGDLTVTSDGVTSAAASLTIQNASPGLFQIAEGRLLAINEDGTFNSADQPAPPGSIMLFYATGCGIYEKPLRSGDQTPVDQLYRLMLPHTLTIGGVAADILFAGAAPLQSTGLVQFNVRVPLVGAESQFVQLTVGGAASTKVTVFVAP